MPVDGRLLNKPGLKMHLDSLVSLVRRILLPKSKIWSLAP